MPWSGIAAAGVGALGSLIGGGIKANSAAQQMDMQREFAQNGIRWKVADAKAAGIHPLAALGAQTFSYNPVATGDYGISEAMARMGQGISRAAEAKQLQQERNEDRAIDNALKTAQTRKLNADADFTLQQATNSAQTVASTALPPPMPKANAKSVPSIAGGYAGSAQPLLTLARVGRTLLDVINPDFADSITESQYRNMIANVSPEWNVAKGYLKAPVDYLEPNERDLVKSGKYRLSRFPGGWLYEPVPTSPAERYKERHGSGAWHDPSNWNWLDRLGQWVKQVF